MFEVASANTPFQSILFPRSPPRSLHPQYKEITVELKKLLSHSHFSVVNHALKALEALFEGVKGPLYPHAKPLVNIILDKAKDKKLTSYCLRSLSTMFGNVVGFSDLGEKGRKFFASQTNLTLSCSLRSPPIAVSETANATESKVRNSDIHITHHCS